MTRRNGRLLLGRSSEREVVLTRTLRPGERAHTGFADGYPFLVVSEASLAELNRRLAAKGQEAVPMTRFRLSLVVAGEAPFAEDGWGELGALDGRWRLGLRKPCQRCKITTIDQVSGEIVVPGEPLRTLVEMNRSLAPGGYFGQNAILLAGEGEVLRLGDAVAA